MVLDNPPSNGKLSQTEAPMPPTRSRGWRVAGIAMIVVVLGLAGLIAQVMSGDVDFNIRDLVSWMQTTRSKSTGASAFDATGAKRMPRDMTPTPTNEPSRWDRHMTPTVTISPTPTPTITGYDRTITQSKRDDFFKPEIREPSKEPPKKDPSTDKTSPTKFERPKEEQEPIDANRKIIRTGEMDFEVDSHEVAVVNITKLIVQIKDAFVADSKSGRLQNGKIHGYLTVRMPPQFLDQFILDLRSDLGKTGELKTQRIHSQDVTKQFTDVESSLKAARTMEKRLLSIIETGKGEIKDLILAENALGEWRTKIEKMEGELRYYANQVSLSTLTISLSERELRTPFALIASENVTMRVEVEDVKQAHRNAEKAVFDAKGRIIRSEVKQHAAGQLEAILHAEVPPDKKDDFGAILRKLGIVSQDESHFQQETRGGAGKPLDSVKPKEEYAHFEISFYNLANVAPRKTTTLRIAATNVPAAYQKLHDAITAAKGQVRDTHLDETDKRNVSATIDFTVAAADKAKLDAALDEAGTRLSRNNVQAAVTKISSDRKIGYHVTLISTVNIQPSEKINLKLEVSDVDESATKMKASAEAVKARLVDAKTQIRPSGETGATLEFDVPLKVKDVLLRQFKEASIKLIGQEEERYPTAPDSDLAIARVQVNISGPNPIVPSDEGFGSYMRTGFYRSFQILGTCVMLIIIGASAILPWLVLIWVGYKIYCRFNPAPPPAAPVMAVTTLAPAEAEKPN